MRLPELRKLAADLGLKGVSALRKGALIAAITNASGDSPAPAADANAAKPRQTRTPRRKDTKPVDDAPAAEADNALEASEDHKPRRRRATRKQAATILANPAPDVIEQTFGSDPVLVAAILRATVQVNDQAARAAQVRPTPETAQDQA